MNHLTTSMILFGRKMGAEKFEPSEFSFHQFFRLTQGGFMVITLG